jgi:hypothetical protein
VSGDKDNEEVCAFCKRGRVIEQTRELAFRQETKKGTVFCKVVVPIGTCEHCGSESVGAAAEAIMEAAVRREYKKLP